MNKENYQAILESVKLLNPEQRATLDQHVRTRRDLHKGVFAIENHMQQAINSGTCRRCGAGNAYLHGRKNDVRQRFRCRPPAQGGCGRSFNGIKSYHEYKKEWGTNLHKILYSSHDFLPSTILNPTTLEIPLVSLNVTFQVDKNVTF